MLKIDPRTPAVVITEGDTAKPFKAVLRDCNGAPVDLSDSTVVLVRVLAGTTTMAQFPCTISPTLPGYISLIWPSTANDVPGDYHFQIIITKDGRTDTHPKGGNYNYELLRILPSLLLTPIPDITAPTVTLLNTPLPDATIYTPYSFTVRIADAVDIDESTITAAAFTVRDPSNALVAKTITGITGTSSVKNVAIQLTPAVEGVFTIASLAGLIADTEGNTAASTTLGQFTVTSIPENALLHTDGSPLIHTDGSYLTYP
jgi:hypothetical protein